MDPLDYKVRCDKCQFKPYVYCEMCMIRTQLQSTIEINRKETREQLSSLCLTISVIHDILNKHEKLINELKGINHEH